MIATIVSSAPMPIPLHDILGDLSYRELDVHSRSRADVLHAVGAASGLISLLNLRVDEELFDAAPLLKVVANYAVGYDNIDVEAATRRGIVVTNTPDVLTNATADLTFALLLAAARRLGESERVVRSGRWAGWAPSLLLGTELTGGRLGVIGAGRIGRAVLRRATGFDMKLAYSGPRPIAEAEALGATRQPVAELLRECDFISLHCPLTAATANLIDADALATMKSSAILVNTARGGCVDQNALASALRAGAIAGAGLDVFADEPQVPEALLASERVVLSPHIGSATWHARSRMAEICASAVSCVLKGQIPPTAINPEVMK